MPVVLSDGDLVERTGVIDVDCPLAAPLAHIRSSSAVGPFHFRPMARRS
jgi:hypothetical protein